MIYAMRNLSDKLKLYVEKCSFFDTSKIISADLVTYILS